MSIAQHLCALLKQQMNDETSSSLQLCYIDHVQPIDLFHCKVFGVFLWAEGFRYFEDVKCLFSLECELVLEAQDSLETHKDMHTFLTIPQNIIEYNPQLNGPHNYINTKPNTHEYYASTTKDPLPLPNPPRSQQLMENLIANILELYNTYVKTNPIQHTLIEYKVKFTKLWQTNPKTTPPTSHNNTYPSQHVIQHKPP